MVDSISLVMFVTPLMVGIIFTMLSYMALKEKKADVGGLMSSLIASIAWFIFGLTWAGVATSDMFLSVAYLWEIFGVIFAIITVYTGLKMMGAIFQENTKPMLSMEADDRDED
jgi:cytochrome c biogenesis protein CcdA